MILVGEIRDHETARIAMQAAQTGHLVLSSLHTDDTPSVLTRLMDIGLEPYVIASALVGVVAQRLVRQLCPDCRRHYTPSSEVLRALNIDEHDAVQVPFYRAVGCDQCNHTGYRGRIGIYEVMPVTDRLRRLIVQRANEDTMREAALSAGMVNLGENGLTKVKNGVTTPEELLRVVTEVKSLRTVCPSCGGAAAVDFIVCPHCGYRLSSGCRKCGRSMQPSWNYCPYCAAAESPKSASKKKMKGVKARELPASNVSEFKKP